MLISLRYLYSFGFKIVKPVIVRFFVIMYAWKDLIMKDIVMIWQKE